MSDTPPVPAFDVARLIADLRKGDESVLDRAYRLTFDNQVGRLVLANILKECGVGEPFGAGSSVDNIHFRAGAHDAGLNIAGRAGFDQAAIVAANFTAELEGNSPDDRSYNHAADGSEFVDDY